MAAKPRRAESAAPKSSPTAMPPTGSSHSSRKMNAAKTPDSNGSDRPKLTVQITMMETTQMARGPSVPGDLDELECYHGAVLEEEIRKMLHKNGDYLLRQGTGSDGTKQVMLSILVNNELTNVPVMSKYYPVLGVVPKREELLYTFDEKTRGPSVKELIRKHTTMSIPVVRNKQEFHLMNPIAKLSWELKYENVELLTKLGEGAFGEVYSGKLKVSFKRFCNVAVKVIKRNSASDQATKDLHKEAAIMRKVKHINIVRFYGLVSNKDKIMVVMELISGGGLDSYLKKHPTTPNDERIGYAADIACGLAYLHGQGVVHRDIACRNMLLDLTNKIAKVSDFGLARAADSVKLGTDERIPIRWTAPEVVKTYVYTRAADTYAYAILVYEIFSNAMLPFNGFTNAQIKDGIQKNDFRPKFPAGTPQEILDLIGKCWQTDPKARPPLADVARLLTAKVAKKVDADHTPTPKPSRPGTGEAEKVNKEKLQQQRTKQTTVTATARLAVKPPARRANTPCKPTAISGRRRTGK